MVGLLDLRREAIFLAGPRVLQQRLSATSLGAPRGVGASQLAWRKVKTKKIAASTKKMRRGHGPKFMDYSSNSRAWAQSASICATSASSESNFASGRMK